MEEDKEYGDFEEIVDENTSEGDANQEFSPSRVRLPGKGEFIGKVVQRLGGSRMDVACSDGKSRNCRVPGRYKRRMWLRPGNFVIVQPWEFDDSKGDVIFQYKDNSVSVLRKKGLLDKISDSF